MDPPAIPIATQNGTSEPAYRRLAGKLVSKASRYGTPLLGTGSVSATHFIMSYAGYRALEASAFGLLSFAIVLSAFCLSLTGALVGTPLSTMTEDSDHSLRSIYSWSLLVIAASGLACLLLLHVAGARFREAATLALYCAAMSFRATGRYAGYAKREARTVLKCDLAYSAIVLTGLFAAFRMGTPSLAVFALVLLLGAGVSALFNPGEALMEHAAAFLRPHFGPYRGLWRRKTKWTFLGTAASEFSSNAHAYVVTLLAGAGAFGLLSLGAMLVRPINLVSKTLGDMELPRFHRDIAAGAPARAIAAAKRLDKINLLVWSATLLVIGAILLLRPDLLVRGRFTRPMVCLVAAIWFAIMFVRISRTSLSLLVQASGDFERLGRTGIRASVISMSLVCVFLLLFGPVGALLGILVSDIWLASRIARLARSRLKVSPPRWLDITLSLQRAGPERPEMLGKGWQYRAFDLGNGRVKKRLRNFAPLFLEVARASRLDRPLQSNDILGQTHRLRRGALLSLETLSRLQGRIPEEMLGNPRYLPRGAYEQDKVTTLRDYFATQDAANCKCAIDKYVAFQQRSWQLGFGDPGFDLLLNNGIDADGNIIQIDLGELVFSREVMMEAARSKSWLSQNSFLLIENAEVRDYFIASFEAGIAAELVERHWATGTA